MQNYRNNVSSSRAILHYAQRPTTYNTDHHNDHHRVLYSHNQSRHLFLSFAHVHWRQDICRVELIFFLTVHLSKYQRETPHRHSLLITIFFLTLTQHIRDDPLSCRCRALCHSLPFAFLFQRNHIRFQRDSS